MAQGITIPKGYALAVLVRGRTSSEDLAAMFRQGDGLPVLAECSGAFGVLRGLSVRMGRIAFDGRCDGPLTVAIVRRCGDGFKMESWILEPKVATR